MVGIEHSLDLWPMGRAALNALKWVQRRPERLRHSSIRSHDIRLIHELLVAMERRVKYILDSLQLDLVLLWLAILPVSCLIFAEYLLHGILVVLKRCLILAQCPLCGQLWQSFLVDVLQFLCWTYHVGFSTIFHVWSCQDLLDRDWIWVRAKFNQHHYSYRWVWSNNYYVRSIELSTFGNGKWRSWWRAPESS